jgi:hypothetical protein
MTNKKHCDNLKLIKESFIFVIRTEPALNQRQEGSSSGGSRIFLTGGDHR